MQSCVNQCDLEDVIKCAVKDRPDNNQLLSFISLHREITQIARQALDLK